MNQSSLIVFTDYYLGGILIPVATLAHLNPRYHGEKASEFIGDRWVGSDKQAVTLSSTYFPFGLGRWACPGRFLAVAGELLYLLSSISMSYFLS